GPRRRLQRPLPDRGAVDRHLLPPLLPGAAAERRERPLLLRRELGAGRRPDLFYRQQDPDLDLATGLAQRVRRDPGAYPEVKSLVATSGVGLTKLNALFRRHYHVTPAAFLQRVRVEEICRALLGGRRRILDLALDAGWDSSSAFHESFRRATAMTPGDYRRLGRGAEFVLDLPAGYRAAAVLRYLARDPESRCERASPASPLSSPSTSGRARRAVGSKGRTEPPPPRRRWPPPTGSPSDSSG